MKLKNIISTCLLASSLLPVAGNAAELEVTHWWTSGGEAAAVGELADAFNSQTSHTWVDGAIAGSGGTARPIIVSRIIGGDPMGATQLNHGRQAEELVEADLMLDLTDVAQRDNWRNIIHPVSLLDSCTVDGRVYCAPVNIHSWQWIWLSHAAYQQAGVAVPTNWDEFVASAPALESAGLIPLAMGQQPWQVNGAFNVILIAIGGIDLWETIFVDRDDSAVTSPAANRVFQAVGDLRKLSANSNVQDWNQATNLVITGKAGGQIMGDWAQGEFQVANQTAGTDYSCLPGLGVHEIISTGGDAFYFPKQDDPEVTAAQKELAALLISKQVQVAFNLKKGSLPIRGDVDLADTNDCMKKGLEILAQGNILTDVNQLISPDTQVQLEDLLVEFWNDSSFTVADLQSRYQSIIARAN